jgi:hypothetical protein
VAQFATLAEAISAALNDGDTVAMEGFTHLIPHAAGHEVIRQGRRDLTLIRMTPDIIYGVLRGYRGTSLPAHTTGVADVVCPFTGETLTAVSTAPVAGTPPQTSPAAAVVGQ